MQDTSSTLLLLASFLTGIALIVLCLISLKQRNPYFEKRFRHLAILSSLVILVPPLLLLSYLSWIAPGGLEKWEQSVREKWEKTKYINEIDLKWDATEVTALPFLKDLTKTLETRLHPAKELQHGRLISSPDASKEDAKQSHLQGLVESISHDLDRAGGGPVTTIHLEPKKVRPDSPELDKILKSIYPKPPQDLSTGESGSTVSIRSVHPGQERLAASGYPSAPTGYTQLPWKDGFVYVGNGTHIDESHITHADPYGDDNIIATVSPEGQIRMMTMARKLSQIDVPVAVLLNNSVRGVYTPTPSITDQFMISSIPLSQQHIALIADSLSMPNRWGPKFTTTIVFSPPRPDADEWSTHWWRIVKNYVLPHTAHIVLALFLLSIFSSIAALTILHVKTRNR